MNCMNDSKYQEAWEKAQRDQEATNLEESLMGIPVPKTEDEELEEMWEWLNGRII